MNQGSPVRGTGPVAKWVGRIASGLMGALFVWAAFLQLNDPDSALWIVVYLVAALPALAVSFGRPLPWLVPAAIGTVAIVWSIGLATVVFGSGEVRAMFPSEEATGNILVDSEEGRELGGLAIVAGTMAALATFGMRGRRRT